MLDWMVIYPRGDRKRLGIAQVRDYERSEWDLASEKRFGYDKIACEEYMIELAKKHNLKYPGHTAYLD